MTGTRDNQEWLHDLAASGEEQETAIADLRTILLRASLYFFNRNLGDFAGRERGEILQKAEDCAQDALIAVMGHLQDFRGDSKFSTWAYKFAINMALMAARRERWKGVSLDELSTADESTVLQGVTQDRPEGILPEQLAIQGEVREIIQQVIRHDLTDRQRQVLALMVFNEVPMDEVVRHFGSNRNTVYKLLHDARRKLKSGLQARGFAIEDTIPLFSTHSIGF